MLMGEQVQLTHITVQTFGAIAIGVVVLAFIANVAVYLHQYTRSKLVYTLLLPNDTLHL